MKIIKNDEYFLAMVAHDSSVLNVNWASIVLSSESRGRLTEDVRPGKKVCDRKIYLYEIGLSWSVSPLSEWAPVLMIIAVCGSDYSSLMVSAC